MLPSSLEQRSLERNAAAFWNKTLGEWVYEPPLQPDVIGKETSKAMVEIGIPAAIISAMDRYCKEREDLRSIFFFGAWSTVLMAFTQSERELIIAIPVKHSIQTGINGRLLAPIRIEKPNVSHSFKKWLEQLFETYRKTYQFMDYWQNSPDKQTFSEGYERFVFSYEPMNGREFMNSFAEANGTEVLSHISKTAAGEWMCSFYYDAGAYSAGLMSSVAESFIAVLEQAADNPEGNLSTFELRSRDEISRQECWNDTCLPFDKAQTFHEGFERISALYPDQLAVVSGSDHLTYRDLSERSDRMARRLIAEGICPGNRVSVRMDRSIEWVTAFLAVLKAGGVYIPIDPSYPASRIEYMLSDSQSTALIVSDMQGSTLEFKGIIIDISHEPAQIGESIRSAQLPLVSAVDLAYILYTSGSTGVPKGVMVEHLGLANLQSYFTHVLGICEDDRVLQFASASFDASIWEMAMALLVGAQLHIAEPEVIGDFLQFERFAGEHAVSVATLPPTYAVHLDPERLSTIRMLITAGSESNRELLSQWNNQAAYVNAYGPTETTVCATAWNYSMESVLESALIPIGKPLPNVQIRIVNKWLQSLPSNIPGELVVAGSGLARGYWNKPELTEEKFVLLNADGTRFYRTGDLARWAADGNLVFLGRLDHQVKIRGFRIETEEVRHVLMEQVGVREAVVTVKPDIQGEAALIAYYATEPDNSPDSALLREMLSMRLPGYMMPAYWVELPSIPLTPNGKPDLKALPGAAEWNSHIDRPNGHPPLGETEVLLAELWKKHLGVDRVGREDHFFQLGGHSMKAAKMAASLYQTFGVNMPLEQMFRYATMQEMAEWIDNFGKQCKIPDIPAASIKHGYSLSPSQRRVFTIENTYPSSTLYVLPFAFWMEPAPDFERLEAAFVHLIDRHEPLRTSFGWEGGEPVQIIHTQVPFRIERISQCTDTLAELTERLIVPFTLNQPPLLRVALVEFTDGSTLLLLHLHHIIADGLSLAILMNDLAALLMDIQLQPLKLQYKDYCEWTNNRESSSVHEAFWEERFNGYISTPDLPIDLPRPLSRRFEGESLSLQWDKAMADSIRKLAIRCDTTVHLTMLAAYYVLLSKVTGSEEGVIGSLHAGREHPATNNMVGMFVHTLAHRNQVEGDLTFEAFAREVKKRVAEDYEHADFPYEMLVRKLKLRDNTRNPLFDTMFVLQNLDAPTSQTGNVSWTPLVLHEKWSRFDLVFQAWDNEEGLLLWVTYSSSLFRRTTVEKLVEDYRKLIEQLAMNTDMRIRDLSLDTSYRPIKAANLSLDFHF